MMCDINIGFYFIALDVNLPNKYKIRLRNLYKLIVEGLNLCLIHDIMVLTIKIYVCKWYDITL